MQVSHELPHKNIIKPVQNMNIGEIGIIRGIRAYEGKYIIRTYDNFMCLNEPRCTWSQPLFEAEMLPTGTIITLIVGE